MDAIGGVVAAIGDKSHAHLPWGKTLNAEGHTVFATSLEAECPRKFCISLVQCILRQLQRQNMAIAPEALFDIKDSRAYEMQTARVFCAAATTKNQTASPHS